jgi:hypothetical protein
MKVANVPKLISRESNIKLKWLCEMFRFDVA